MDGISPPEPTFFVIAMYGVILVAIIVIGYSLFVRLGALGFILLFISGLIIIISIVRWLTANPENWIAQVVDAILIWFLNFTRIIE